MRHRPLPLICLLALLCADAVPAQGPGPEGMAERRLSELRAATAADDQARLLGLLRSTATEGAWPAEERERVLFDFLRHLRTMPPGAAGVEAMAFLHSYSPQVLVPHEENPEATVPRYPVRAAAAGVANEWRRQEAAYTGAVLLAQDPAALVRAYRLQADPAMRQGLLDALDTAGPGALGVVSSLALDGMPGQPGLAQLAGRAALLSGDASALGELIRNGGAGLAEVLRGARSALDGERLAALLELAIDTAPAEAAAIAIAELSPALLDQAETRARLLGLLGDRSLGAPAALALAADPGARSMVELAALAEAGTGSLAAQRAQLALGLMGSGLTPERER